MSASNSNIAHHIQHSIPQNIDQPRNVQPAHAPKMGRRAISEQIAQAQEDTNPTSNTNHIAKAGRRKPQDSVSRQSMSQDNSATPSEATQINARISNGHQKSHPLSNFGRVPYSAPELSYVQSKNPYKAEAPAEYGNQSINYQAQTYLTPEPYSIPPQQHYMQQRYAHQNLQMPGQQQSVQQDYYVDESYYPAVYPQMQNMNIPGYSTHHGYYESESNGYQDYSTNEQHANLAYMYENQHYTGQNQGYFQPVIEEENYSDAAYAEQQYNFYQQPYPEQSYLQQLQPHSYPEPQPQTQGQEYPNYSQQKGQSLMPQHHADQYNPAHGRRHRPVGDKVEVAPSSTDGLSSRDAREARKPVAYKPISVSEFKEKYPEHKKKYVELGKLGPDLGSEELLQKKAILEKRKEYSRNLRGLVHVLSEDEKKELELKQNQSRLEKAQTRIKATEYAKKVREKKPGLAPSSEADNDSYRYYEESAMSDQSHNED